MKVLLCFIMLLSLCSCRIEPISEELPWVESLIESSGNTLETRIKTPESYQRIESDDFGKFLRNYELKEDGSPVLLYDGSKKMNQSDHIAVFKLPIENEDLQQCADSIMRIYAEYYYHRGEYDKISFQFVDGFIADYDKWVEGYRIHFNEGKPSWYKATSKDTSYDTFKKYMRIVFAYSSTLSLYDESYEIELSQIQIGDIFLKAGSPGHVVMVVDICENSNGKKAFLLAQGYMPAQEFHVIKNPNSDDPWYYEEDISYPFVTAGYTFEEGSLRRLKYLK